MQTNYYRETLKESVGKLIEIRGELFDMLFNVAVTGELKEWADDVPVGDNFHITKDIFQGCEDINMKILVKLLDNVEGTIDSICNLNDIELSSNECDEEDK